MIVLKQGAMCGNVVMRSSPRLLHLIDEVALPYLIPVSHDYDIHQSSQFSKCMCLLASSPASSQFFSVARRFKKNWEEPRDKAMCLLSVSWAH